MTKFRKLSVGECLSETQYYTVDKIVGDKVQLSTDNGGKVVVDSKYVESYLISATQYDKEEKVSRTALAENIMSHPRVVMTVNYNKQVKEADVVERLEKEIASSSKTILKTRLKAVVKSVLDGEERTLVGRHSNSLDAGGRIQFVDMQIEKDDSKSYDPRMRLVDPRTLNWAIINGVKYVVK